MKKKLIVNLISALFWLAVWQAASIAVASPLLLPGPVSVAKRLVDLSGTSQFWQTAGISLLRILLGIFAALVLGVLTAVVCCRFSLARAVIAPAINIVKATPVASFIMLALLWLDRNILPVFITVLIALPVVHSNVSGGIFAIDRGLLQVCRSFGFGFWKKIRILYIPSVFPYFLSACRSSLGLAWKAGVAAEVLAVPAVSIGKMIYGSKMYLETTDLFAWSAVVIVLSVIIENVICAALSRAGRRYERQGV